MPGLPLVFSACAAEYLPPFSFCGTLRGRGCILRLETSCNTPDCIARLRAFLGACARCFRPRAFFCVRILTGSPLDHCPGSAPAACRDLDRRGLLLPILLDLAARPALVLVVAACRPAPVRPGIIRDRPPLLHPGPFRASLVLSMPAGHVVKPSPLLVCIASFFLRALLASLLQRCQLAPPGPVPIRPASLCLSLLRLSLPRLPAALLLFCHISELSRAFRRFQELLRGNTA